MTKSLAICALVAAQTFALQGNCAEVPRQEYPAVSFGSWEYDALRATVPLRFWPPLRPGVKSRPPMMRIEFAVAIMRGLKNQVSSSDPELDSLNGTTALERLDALAALQREFSVEIGCLGKRGGCGDERNLSEGDKIAKPPRLIITPGVLRRSIIAP